MFMILNEKPNSENANIDWPGFKASWQW